MPAGESTQAANDVWNSLEDRILRAVQLIEELRARLRAAESDPASSPASEEVQQLREENRSLREERDALLREQAAVEERLLKLLEQLQAVTG